MAEYAKEAEKTGYKAEGVDLRKRIHTKVMIACTQCGHGLDACDVLKDHTKDGTGEWIYVNVATKEVQCKKCQNTTFKIFEVIDKRV